MPEAPPPNLMTELRVSAHLMLLESGVYCVHHSPGSTAPDPKTGLPSARISLPPGTLEGGVAITGFRDDGWLAGLDSVALVRVSGGPAHVLMTIYQAPSSSQEAPKLQVTRLVEGAALPGIAAERVAPGQAAVPPAEPEMVAHVQARGDAVARLGDWLGERSSGRWVEGFALSPHREELAAEDIEYQAVLGRGWLSPWAEAGQFCGSRGMALPILGLRVRLRGGAAEMRALQVSATFTDGTAVGPVGSGEACEAESLAPLEAFCVTVVPKPRAKAAPPAQASAKPPAQASAKPPVKRPAALSAKAPAEPVAKRGAPARQPAKAAPKPRRR